MHKNILFVSATILIFLSNFVHASAADKLHFGIPPIYSEATINEGFTPVMKHLSEFIGAPVELVVSESYESLVEDLKSGKVQFAILGPALYVQARKIYPKLKYLATTQTTKSGQKRSYYYGHIIVTKDSDMKNISDLKGKSFAYVSEHSTSGYRFPRLFFSKRNINPDEYFSQVIFAGSHTNVTDMIAKHELDVGVTYDINLWDAERKHGKIFRTIAKIGPIVDLALVANHRVSDNLTTSLVDALSSIPEEYLSSHFPYSGITVLSDSNYDLVRDVIAMKKPDKTASIILEGALRSGDLNVIYDAFDLNNSPSFLISNMLRYRLVSNYHKVRVTGKIVGEIKDFVHGDGWTTEKQVAVIEIKGGRKAYVINMDTSRLNGKEVFVTGIAAGMKGTELIIKPHPTN